MAVNKVEFGNQTIMDITDTSATPDEVVEGQVFYSAAGVRSTGTLTDATQEVHGLMSAADKVKLDGFSTDGDYAVNSMIAPTEETLTASQLYNIDDYFIYNHQLYKATSAIATGATISPNTNCVAVPVISCITEKVTGPSSATNNAVAIFNGTTGKIIKNSGYTIGKSVPSNAVFTDTTTTNLFSRPTYQADVSDITLQSLVNDLRANHLAFLPPDQIIIEKTFDGGQTWTDAGISDDAKRSLFAETRTSIALPKIDGKKNILCGLRVTFTAMKYDVPANTPEVQKYDYWNYNYVLSTERYNNLRDFYFWVSSDADKLKIKVQCATGENPTAWFTAFENNNALFQGWSGNDYIRLSQTCVFGGSTTQKSNFWNYRITFMSAYNEGASEFSPNYITNSQGIQEIRGYGTKWWTAGNKYASSDHMYSWDNNKNVTFPAKVTATNFVGTVNGCTIAASVPSGAIFTDTTYESKAAASGGTAVSLVTTGEKYTWNNKYSKPSGGIPASDLAETYLTSFTETDPTVPAWAKQSTKPTYTAQEVGALPSNTTYVSTVNGSSGAVTITIPTKVSDLTDDSGHYTKPTGGIPASDIASGVIPDVSGKADKVTSATNGNFAALDSNGNLVDSGHKHSDYLTSHQDISGKLNAPATAGTSGQVLTSDGSGGQTWETPSAGTITDVQVNGSTVVSNGIASITLTDELPTVTSTDNGSFLRVVNGAWAVAAIGEANGESF